MLWTLMSIVVAFAELVAFMSAEWLVGYPDGSEFNFTITASHRSDQRTLGIYNRCIKVAQQKVVQCGAYATDFTEIASGFWQATVIFLVIGIFLLSLVAILSVFSMCFQSILKKSIFNVCGLLQGIAGKMGKPTVALLFKILGSLCGGSWWSSLTLNHYQLNRKLGRVFKWDTEAAPRMLWSHGFKALTFL